MSIFHALQKQRRLISSLQLLLMGFIWFCLTFHSCVYAASATEIKLHFCCEYAHEDCDPAASHAPGDTCSWMSETDNSSNRDYSVSHNVSSQQPAIGYTHVLFPLHSRQPFIPSPEKLALTASHPALKFRVLLI